jgi:hypothetical protein
LGVLVTSFKCPYDDSIIKKAEIANDWEDFKGAIEDLAQISGSTIIGAEVNPND